MIKTRQLTIAVLIGSLTALVVISATSGRGSPVEDNDVLAYSHFTYEDDTTLYLYDTSRGEHREIYQTDGHIWFAFSADGRIAFSTDWTWENNGELFIVDTSASDQVPFDLTREIEMRGYPLGWSHDGQYLAFASAEEGSESQSLYVWDGNSVTNITPDPDDMLSEPDSFDIAWSYDGRLAFTVWFGGSNLDPLPEIYIWDREATSNLSQNPDAEDREPTWNTEGELAFGSYRDNEMTLLMWDGESYADGVPDASSFSRIASELRVFSPFAVWFNSDYLAFEAFGPQDTQVQIYSWDGRTWLNIGQVADTNSYTPQWSQDGHWAFVTGQGRLYVRDIDNSTVFETHGHGPAWSSGGSLVFCRRDGRTGWKLSRWDRASVSTLATGDVIFAQWQSGQETICSSG